MSEDFAETLERVRASADKFEQERGIAAPAEAEETPSVTEAEGEPKAPEQVATDAPEKEEATEESQEERKARMAELKTIAKELGLKVNEGEIDSREFAALRVERRKNEERLHKAEKELSDTYGKKVAELEGELNSARAIRNALANRDLDSFAKMAGFKGFGDMATAYAEGASDPAQRKVAELERRILEKEQREQELSRRNHEQTLAQQQAQAQQQYAVELQGELKSSHDERIAELSQDPSFVSLVVQIQRDNWDGNTTLDTDEAAELALRRVEESYKRVAPILSREKPRGTSAESITSEGRRKPPKSVSQTQAAQVASTAGMTDEQKLKHFSSLLRKSHQ